MTTQEPSIPQWFLEFVQDNNRQHTELGNAIHANTARTSGVEGELRIIRMLLYGIFGTLLATLGTALFYVATNGSGA